MLLKNYKYEFYKAHSANCFLEGKEYSRGLVLVHKDIKIIEVYGDKSEDLTNYIWIELDEDAIPMTYKRLSKDDINELRRKN